MAACVHFKRLSVLNVKDQCGIMEAESSSAHFVISTFAKVIILSTCIFYVTSTFMNWFAKTTSLNTKRHVKSWRQRRTNASHAIGTVSTAVSDVRHVTAKTTSGVKDSSTNEASRCRVPNAASRPTKPKI